MGDDTVFTARINEEDASTFFSHFQNKNEYTQLVHAFWEKHWDFHFIETNWTVTVVIAFKAGHEVISKFAGTLVSWLSLLSKARNEIIDVDLSSIVR